MFLTVFLSSPYQSQNLINGSCLVLYKHEHNRLLPSIRSSASLALVTFLSVKLQTRFEDMTDNVVLRPSHHWLAADTASRCGYVCFQQFAQFEGAQLGRSHRLGWRVLEWQPIMDQDFEGAFCVLKREPLDLQWITCWSSSPNNYKEGKEVFLEYLFKSRTCVCHAQKWRLGS